MSTSKKIGYEDGMEECLKVDVIVDLAAGHLSPAEMALLETHIDECSECRHVVAAYIEDTHDDHTGVTLLRPGATVGRYVVVDVIGAGSMGIVFEAHDPQLDRKVALKLMRVDIDDDSAHTSGRQERLQLEARAMARVAHPNVITVYDSGLFEDGRFFIAMERVDGSTLSAWLASKTRSWSEIVQQFIQAARGLEAAHAAGIIHRDFKPDNVLVGDDGRTRVSDFGLVGATPELAPESELFVEQVATPLRLTQTGVVIGTARYMAPEQHRREALDARADQFAFCVALYEALYGSPPFSGSTYGELRRSVLSGTINTPPQGSSIPTWLHAVVLRGLSQDPEQRYANMGALLVDLEHSNLTAGKRRRSWLLLVGAAGLLAVAAYVFVSSQNNSDPCENAAQDMNATWNADVAEQVRTTVLSSQKANAEVTLDRLTSAAGDYAQEWTSMRQQACWATHVSHTQSDQLMDLRMQCLDSKRVALKERLTVLIESGAQPKVVDGAANALLRLPSLSACADRDALTSVLPLPKDASKRQRIASLQRQLARLHALDITGQLKQARELAVKVARESRELDYPPVHARALLGVANLDIHDDKFDLAVARLREAAKTAALARDDELTVEIWLKLLWTVTVEQEHYEELPALQLAVESSAARAAQPKKWQAKLQNVLGAISRHQGNYEDAYTRYKQSLALFAQAPDTLELDTAMVLSNLGIVARRLRKYQEARSYLTQSIEISKRAYGSPHPEIARALNSLGVLAKYEGDYAQANEHYSRSLEMKEELFGPNHDSVATALNNLGSLKNMEGKLQEAAPYYERALAIWENVHGPDHTAVAIALVNLGEVSNDAGDYHKAIERCGRALGIFEQRIGMENPDLAYPLNCLSAAYVDLGESRNAVPLLRRAIQVQDTESANLPLLASSQLELARVLWAEKRGRPDATLLAQQAAANFRAAGKVGSEGLAESETWLQQRNLTLPNRP